MAQSDAKRLHYLDALRGIAALSVVVAHYILDLPHVPGQAPDAGFIAGFDEVFDVGKFGVVLFFLISGYIIPNSLGASGDRIGRFCVSRFFRLYPLYWFALAIGVLLPLAPFEHGFPSATILANTTMVQGYLHKPDIIGAAWTLQIELTFYATCLVLASLRKMTSPRVCAGISAGFLAFAFALAVARNVLVMKLPVALPLALSVMYFGTVWRQATLARIPEAKRLASWLLALLSVMIIPISLIGYNHDFGFNERWLPYATSYLLAISVFLLCTTRVLIGWRPVVRLGEISYSLYLIHPLVAAAFFYAGAGAVAMPVSPPVMILPMIAAAVLCSWATYHFIEKPFVALGHRLAPARRAAPQAYGVLGASPPA